VKVTNGTATVNAEVLHMVKTGHWVRT